MLFLYVTTQSFLLLSVLPLNYTASGFPFIFSDRMQALEKSPGHQLAKFMTSIRHINQLKNYASVLQYKSFHLDISSIKKTNHLLSFSTCVLINKNLKKLILSWLLFTHQTSHFPEHWMYEVCFLRVYRILLHIAMRPSNSTIRRNRREINLFHLFILQNHINTEQL